MDERTKEDIKTSKIRIRNNGGEVREMAKLIILPPRTGLKVWSAIDCLVNYASYHAIREM